MGDTNDDRNLVLPFGDPCVDVRIVAVEGLDGAGKTTFLEGLERALRAHGFVVAALGLPSPIARGLPMFNTFRQITPKYEPAVYDPFAMQVFLMADRIHFLATRFRELVKGSDVALFDRYIISGAAHLLVHGERLDGWFFDLCRRLPRPDAAVYLRAPYEIARARVLSRAEEANDDFDEERFLQLQRSSDAIAKANGMITVDTGSIGPDQYAPVFDAVANRLRIGG